MFIRQGLIIENIAIGLSRHFNGLGGLKILHFSDMHLTKKNKKFDGFFAQLSKIECDLAICSGDLIDNNNGIEPCLEYLSLLRPKYGTFVSYGNHDRYKLGLKEFIFFPFFYSSYRFTPNNLSLLNNKLSNAGVKVLDNDLAQLDIKGSRVELIGVDSPLGYDRVNDFDRFKPELSKLKGIISKALPESFVILISHVPDLVRDLYGSHANLILSSHTHGGQIRLPFLGPLITLSSFQRRYNSGIFRYNGAYMHVSSGLGVSGSTPIRFRCPPQATVITLESNSNN